MEAAATLDAAAMEGVDAVIAEAGTLDAQASAEAVVAAWVTWESLTRAEVEAALAVMPDEATTSADLVVIATGHAAGR